MRGPQREQTADEPRHSLTQGELEELLARMIATGTLPPGTRIGAERELAERYAISRWTVRKVLESLESTGLIYRTHGRSGGIFVSHQKVVRDLSKLVGLPEYFRAQGLASGTTVVETGTFSSDEQIAKSLEIPVGAWFYKIVRLRFSAGFPLSIEWCYFPAELFPGLLDQALVGSLYELFDTQYSLERGEATEIIEAISANSQRASELQVPVGSPLLSVTRTARTTKGKVFEFSREIYRGERVTVKVQTSGRNDFHPCLVTDKKISGENTGNDIFEIVR